MGLFDGMPGNGNFFSPQLLQMLQARMPAGLGSSNRAYWAPSGMGGGQNLASRQDVVSSNPQGMLGQQGAVSPFMGVGLGGNRAYWTPQQTAPAPPMGGAQGPMGDVTQNVMGGGMGGGLPGGMGGNMGGGLGGNMADVFVGASPPPVPNMMGGGGFGGPQNMIGQQGMPNMMGGMGGAQNRMWRGPPGGKGGGYR